VAAAILAGTYTERLELGPVELDGACPICGGSPVATYDEGVLWVTCGDDHPLFAWTLPPNAVRDQGLRELVGLATVLAAKGIELALRGRCPECYGAMAPTVEVGDATPSGLRLAAGCDTCGSRVDGPLGFALLRQPGMVAFCNRHGLRELRLWELPSVVAGGSLTPDADAHAEVRLELDGEALLVCVDDAGRVTATESEAPPDVSGSE
jgi:hypothetical protein